ncbi:MAG: zinc ribbon domain-containing protein [Desulfovibrio sp.]|nr:zinc ribbon domain-containing protein [Desulfovibrio sp.]
MPIYEYQCPKCGRTFEEWVKISEAHGEEACPDCGTSSPRLISQTSFVLKGGGWYVTDYGYRKGVKEDGAQDKTNSKDEKNKGEKSKETKDAGAQAQAKEKNDSPKPKNESAPSPSTKSSEKTQAKPA